MKKTLITLLALGGVAMGAVKSGSYTWNFSSNSAQLGGTSTGGAFTTTSEEIDGLTTTVLKSANFYELGTSTLYDYIYGAVKEGGTFAVSLKLNYDDTQQYQTILHVGANDTGITLGMSGNSLVFGNASLYTVIATGATVTEGQWHDVTFALTGTTTTVTIGENSYTGSVAWDKMNWSDDADERNKYSIGIKAPGWNNTYVLSSKIADMSVTYTAVPEPTTATLSLLALAGLAARRRRK